MIHVVDTNVVEELAVALKQEFSSLSAEVRTDNQTRLQSAVDATHVGLNAHTEVVIGKVAEEVIRVLRSPSVALTVLGATGESDGTGAGRLAKLCVRKAEVPTLLVRANHKEDFRVVLVGVDFSDTSRIALREAIRLARAEGAKLVVVHSFTPPWIKLHYRAPTPEAEPRFIQQYSDALRLRLEGFSRSTSESLEGLDSQFVLQQALTHGDGLIRAVEVYGADVLVLGTQGRSLLRSRLLGSTAERVLAAAPCSMVTVPPAEFAAP